MTLKNIIKNLKIDVFFQPIVSLDSNKFIGFEALLRGFNNKGKTMYPKEIFDNLNQEEKEKLDVEVFNLATTKAKKLNLYRNYLLFINVSWALPENLARILSLNNYPKNKIVIEICETMSEERFKDYISFFSKENISFAIDDFGSKQSNIDRLLNCQNCTWIKIDKEIASLPFLSLVFSHLSKKSTYNIVIERVEKETDLPTNKHRKNFFAQGFLFGKPSPNPFC